MLRLGIGAVGAPTIKHGLETLAIFIVGILNYAVENNEIIKNNKMMK